MAALIERRAEEHLRLIQKDNILDNDKVIELISTVTRMQSVLEANQIRIEKNTKILVGNGDEGLVSKVSTLVKDMGTLKRLAWIAVGTFVTVGLGDLIYLMVTHPIPGITH